MTSERLIWLQKPSLPGLNGRGLGDIERLATAIQSTRAEIQSERPTAYERRKQRKKK